MTESRKHRDLVLLLKSYVVKNYPNLEQSMMQVDNGESNVAIDKTGHSRPDFIYEDLKTLIIGEAKVDEDTIKEHSIDQYKDYIRECENFDGNAIFILLVPFEWENSAINKMNRIKREIMASHTEVFVINDLCMIGGIKCRK